MENKLKLITLIQRSNVKSFLKEKIKDGKFDFISHQLSKAEFLDEFGSNLQINKMRNEVVNGLEETINNVNDSTHEMVQSNIIDKKDGDFYIIVYTDIDYTIIFGMV